MTIIMMHILYPKYYFYVSQKILFLYFKPNIKLFRLGQKLKLQFYSFRQHSILQNNFKFGKI